MGLFLFSAGTWKNNSNNGAAGFLVMSYNSSILLAGYYLISTTMTSNVEAKAILLALDVIKKQSTFQHIFISSKDLLNTIVISSTQHPWRIDPWIKHINDLLPIIGEPEVHFIPRHWTTATHRLAIYGLRCLASPFFIKAGAYPLDDEDLFEPWFLYVIALLIVVFYPFPLYVWSFSSWFLFFLKFLFVSFLSFWIKSLIALFI